MKEIPVYYAPSSFEHFPQYEIFNGKNDLHEESSARIANIMHALEMSGIADINISTVKSLGIVERVHSYDYIKYLKKTTESARETALANNDPIFAIYPSVHPYNNFGHAENAVALRGTYAFDTYTPIMRNTYEIALDSAGAAIAGAMLLREGQPQVYALTRPPGHHAEKAMMGGYCYINNVAVAAEYLISKGAKKVAIFDFDVHHGNGTQDIFYDRKDVLVVNIHAEPKEKFPYYTGYQDEHGNGEGEGYNFNYPLKLHTEDEAYDQAVKRALEHISRFCPDYLLVSAGFDTHKEEPIGGFSLSTEYYKTLGGRIARFGIPTLSVQEGGYATDVLGQNVVSYLKGLLGK